jgi:hypothetical protein
MTKSGITLSIFALTLGVLYVFFFTDLFQSETIRIIPTVRPTHPVTRHRSKNPDYERSTVYPVSFTFDGKYKFTSVKVVLAEELATSKYPPPLWHLTSESNSMPTKAFMYGQTPKGMKPNVPRARPEPLEAGVEYVLLLEAGNIKAQTNFRTAEMAASGR